MPSLKRQSQVFSNAKQTPTRSNNVSFLNSNPFLKLQNEVNHAMSDFYDLFQPLSANFDRFERSLLSPALDIVEDKNCFKIHAEMPGMDENDINILLENNRLIIRGDKTTSTKEERKSFINREISYGHYERSITLPQTANCDKAKATFNKGILCVTIPKRALTKSSSKKLKIERESRRK